MNWGKRSILHLSFFRSPTTARWWMLQSQPTQHRQCFGIPPPPGGGCFNPNLLAWRLGLNYPPPAGGGIWEVALADGRSGLNDPPPAGGGFRGQRYAMVFGNRKYFHADSSTL